MSRRSREFPVRVLVLIALPIAGCPRKSSEPAKTNSPNVLLVLVDTLRADKLGCYGSDLGATPRIDALAAGGMRFERAFAHAPWTLPSVASLLTSQYPLRHGAGGHLGGFTRLRDGVPTLPGRFRDAGYATAAVINVDFLGQVFGMTRGFEHVDFEAYPSNEKVRTAERTTSAALEWLGRSREQPFFLLVHYFDPHLVYDPPPAFRQKFAAPPDQQDESWVFGTRSQVVGFRRGLVKFDQPTIQRAEKLYNGEVAFTDEQVGRLLDGLTTLGLADSTLVVFTADHGEEFLDHGGFEHGHTLYDELVRVPLIIRDPRHNASGTIAARVGLIDLAPTLCALAGIAPPKEFSGRSLVELIAGGSLDDRPIAMEGNFWGPPNLGWVEGSYKLIVPAGGQPMLFDIGADPEERKDLSPLEADRVRRMMEDLSLARKSMEALGRGGDLSIYLTPQELERLKSLGYVE